MKNKKEKWIDDVLSSTQGMSRARPDAVLFDRINAALELAQVKVIPMYYVKIAAAAAVILLAVNIFATINYPEQPSEQVIEGNYASQESELFIDYNIYGS